MTVQGRVWEIPCRSDAGIAGTFTVFVAGDRIVILTPRPHASSLSIADTSRLIEALQAAAREAAGTAT